MANGTTKPISEVAVGDEVLATDPDTGQTTAREVTAVWVSPHDGDLLDIAITGPDGAVGVVETTDGHKFWSVTVEGWVEAQHLTAGEALRQPDGTTATIATLTPQVGAADMWDLTVAVDHNFYVTYTDNADDSVLVHNCPNLGNLKKMTPDQVEEGLGMTPHQLKDALDLDGPISRFDIYRDGAEVYLVEKSTGTVIETGYTIG